MIYTVTYTVKYTVNQNRRFRIKEYLCLTST